MNQPMHFKEIEATLIKGHQVASGTAPGVFYGQGTINLQKPFFKDLGLNLDDYYNGTLNFNIAPYQISHKIPDHQFSLLKWHNDIPPETFSFIKLKLRHRGQWYAGFVYVPHPETKVDHFQPNNTIEVLMPFIKDLHYGDKVCLQVGAQHLMA